MPLAPPGAAAPIPSSDSGPVPSPSVPEVVFSAPIVNRLIDEPVTVSPPAPATLQRDAQEILAPGAGIAGEPAASPRPEAGAPSGHGTAAPPSDQQLDDLAGKLYDRFRARFRMELLIDRERAGLITDLR